MAQRLQKLVSFQKDEKSLKQFADKYFKSGGFSDFCKEHLKKLQLQVQGKLPDEKEKMKVELEAYIEKIIEKKLADKNIILKDKEKTALKKNIKLNVSQFM